MSVDSGSIADITPRKIVRNVEEFIKLPFLLPKKKLRLVYGVRLRPGPSPASLCQAACNYQLVLLSILKNILEIGKREFVDEREKR